MTFFTDYLRFIVVSMRNQREEREKVEYDIVRGVLNPSNLYWTCLSIPKAIC